MITSDGGFQFDNEFTWYFYSYNLNVFINNVWVDYIV